jgi:hypothetical protein
MPDTPKNSCPGGAADLVLPAHNCGYGNHVVRIGGVPHPEKEPDGDDGKKADHCYFGILQLANSNWQLARAISPLPNCQRAFYIQPPEQLFLPSSVISVNQW